MTLADIARRVFRITGGRVAAGPVVDPEAPALRRSNDELERTVTKLYGTIEQLWNERLELHRGIAWLNEDREKAATATAALRATGLERALTLVAGQAARPIVIWGAGSGGRRLKALMPRPIAAVVDSDAAKAGTTFEDVPIVSPRSLETPPLSDAFVVVASARTTEIAAHLTALGKTEGADFFGVEFDELVALETLHATARRAMRVSFVLNEPDQPNGPNIWLTRHLPALKRLGLAPELLVVTWSAERTCRYAEALERQGIPVTWVQLEGYADAAILKLLSVLAANPPDVFVPNCCVPAYVAARFLRDAGVMTIAILHSDDPYYHELFDMFVAGPAEWRVSAVVGVSAFLRELVHAKAGWAVPFLDAPYGAPVPSTHARWRADGLRAVYAGRLVEPQKRVARVAAHLVAAARALPEFDAIMYGDGAERERLAQLFASAECSGRVGLGGVLPPERLQEAMTQAQVFVLLSEFEGLSIAMMEAMAAGVVPIVSRMRSGVADLVRDGETGFVIDADDQDAFVDRCRRLSSDRALWERLSEAARATIIQRGYTPEECARGWAAFIRKLAFATAPVASVTLPSASDLNRDRVQVRPGGVIEIHYRPATDPYPEQLEVIG